MQTLATEFCFTVRAELAAVQTVGDMTRGVLCFVPILGGSFQGPRLPDRSAKAAATGRSCHPAALMLRHATSSAPTTRGPSRWSIGGGVEPSPMSCAG